MNDQPRPKRPGQQRPGTDQPRHVLVISYPAVGHINPTLPVVRALIARGHHVTYVVPEQYADRVADAGAEVVEYPSLSPSEWSDVPIPQHPSADQLAQTQWDTVRETLTPLPAIAEHFGDRRPDLIFYDALGSAGGRLLSLAWDVPTIVLCTTLTWNEQFSPYEDLPEPDPNHPKLVAAERVLREALDAWGLHDVEVGEFLMGSAERCRAVCVPREFHPGHETFDERYHFVGPCLRDDAEDAAWSPPDDKPVVLVSPGTMGYAHLSELFRTVLRAVEGQPWHVVLATGGVDPQELGQVPDNVEVHEHIPQMSVLRHAGAFLSHGGMNSTMEALAHGVPLVELAQTGEQRTVAKRVEELGLGRALEPDSLDPHQLRDAIEHVLTAESIGIAVRTMRELIAETRGQEEIADLVAERTARSSEEFP